MTITAKSSLFGFLMLFGSLLQAQTNPQKSGATVRPTPAQSADQAEMKADLEMENELKLTPQQKEQFKKINQEYKEEGKAARAEKKEDRQKMQDERRKAHKAILTPEQARQYDEMATKRQAKRADKKDGKRADKKSQKPAKKRAGKAAPTDASGE